MDDNSNGSWLSKRLRDLSSIQGYIKPDRLKDKATVIRMDTNENLVLEEGFVKDVIHEALSCIDPRLYPEQYDEVKEGIARYLNLSRDNIALGNGSDQLIDLALLAFGSNRSSVTLKPTFSFYKDRCKVHGIRLKEITLDKDLLFNMNDILDSDADICYICSPNNPTGNQFSKDIMLDLMDRFNGLIMIDEAYVEFANYSLCHEAVKRENVIVFRTFSKAFALAGARIGYIVSCKDIIDVFNRVIQYPYAVSSITLMAALFMLKHIDRIKQTVEYIKRERERLYNELNSIHGVKAFRSDANFLLFTSPCNDLYDKLRARGILVRNIGDVACYRSCLRVSLSMYHINNIFIDTVKDIIKDC